MSEPKYADLALLCEYRECLYHAKDEEEYSHYYSKIIEAFDSNREVATNVAKELIRAEKQRGNSLTSILGYDSSVITTGLKRNFNMYITKTVQLCNGLGVSMDSLFFGEDLPLWVPQPIADFIDILLEYGTDEAEMRQNIILEASKFRPIYLPGQQQGPDVCRERMLEETERKGVPIAKLLGEHRNAAMKISFDKFMKGSDFILSRFSQAMFYAFYLQCSLDYLFNKTNSLNRQLYLQSKDLTLSIEWTPVINSLLLLSHEDVLKVIGRVASKYYF